MKLQTKTAILFTMLTATVFLVLTAVIYYVSNQFASNDFYKRLELRARISAKFRFEQDHVSTETFKQIQQQYLQRLQDEQAFIVEWKNNQPIAPPRQLPLTYLQSVAHANGATRYYQNKFRHYAGILYRDEKGDFLVIKSAINTYGNELMGQLRDVLIITFIVSVIIIYSLGLYFSKKAFEPFRYITSRVQQISEGNLHVRLEEPSGNDEIAELTRTFNKMLDRLETAFETQNNFISNASHEFRTPLTSIVAEADYALSRERKTEEYQQILVNIVQQAERLQHITKGLLSLAQTGFDGKKQTWELIRVDQLLFDVKENTDMVWQKNKIVINLPDLPSDDADICLNGNYDLLKIAIGNVVLNACKYSDNKPVSIQLLLQNQEALIKITDSGIGIPAEDMKHIYDPFFRASNAKSFEGYGVGLPLSNNIIRLHQGRILVESTVGKGTVVNIYLPLYQ